MTPSLQAAGALRDEIRATYRDVARDPDGDYQFETGRPLAERLGYPADWLDAVAPEALARFAGVGHFLDLAEIRPGDVVLDLGSGSGTDAAIAAHLAGPTGSVLGVDMTHDQVVSARRHAAPNVEFVEGLIESPPVIGESVDVVIANGAINLAPDKQRVFDSAAWALRPGGRAAFAIVVCELQLPASTREDADLWSACIAGAIPLARCLEALEAAGLRTDTVRANAGYGFHSPEAEEIAQRYGVSSVSIAASKRGPGRVTPKAAPR
jgi:ubiquinone/menaquinone biosynthesis C-methylase UbiE